MGSSNKASTSTKKSLSLASLGKEGPHAEEFTIDGITLIRNACYGIQIKCWECGENTQSLSKLQEHLISKHGGSECPGKRCGGFITLPNQKMDFSTHIELHHYWTRCSLDHVVYLPEYGDHIENFCNVEEGDEGIWELRRDSIVFPSEEVTPKKRKTKGRGSGTYYLNGEICKVDGIEFIIRKDDLSIIVDCPHCQKAIGLDLLGSHLGEDHSIFEDIPCLSPQCSFRCSQPSHLSRHVLEDHGSLRCKKCFLSLTIHEVRIHLQTRCPSRLKDSGPVLPLNYPTLTCYLCPAQVLHLNKHIADKHKDITQCLICSKNLKKTALHTHMSKQHKDTKNLYYKKCGVCQADVIKLDNHMEAMHPSWPNKSSL